MEQCSYILLTHYAPPRRQRLYNIYYTNKRVFIIILIMLD